MTGNETDRWLHSYSRICAGVLAVVAVALILLVWFGDLGLSIHGVIALFLGSFFTVLLAMGLMGLVFLSDRGGRDIAAHGAGAARHEEEHHPR